MTGAEAIVQSLIAHGVDTLFTLPGVQLDALFNALHDAGPQIRTIATRHEQGAAYMAWGYAAAGDRVGAYAVVPGPGVLNTTAALSTAYATNDRVLCVAGQIHSSFIGRGAGWLHEIPDQLGVLRSLTKWAERIESPADAPGRIAEAMRQMHSGRPRPTAVEVAMDMLGAEGEVAVPPAEIAPERPALDPDAIARAAKVLGEAENPLFFVGGGAMDAGEAVAAIAELLEAPVIGSMGGRGVLSSRHELSHSLPVGHRLWPEADVVLAIGTRLLHPQVHWGLDDDLKIVRIDIDPAEPGRIAEPEVAIVADAAEALAALLPQVARHNRKRPGRRDALRALKAETEAEFARLQPTHGYLMAIREALPDEGIFVDGLTQVGYVGRFALPVYRPRTYISSNYQGTLGAEYATGLGVKVARPDVPVLVVAGDGGLLYTIPELATAVQHKIGTVTVVFNDNGYGNVRRMQRDLYDNRVIGTDLVNPDFVRLAETFGAQGLRAETPDALLAAIRRGFDTEGPTLIEVPLGDTPDPWQHVLLPKVRGGSGRVPIV